MPILVAAMARAQAPPAAPAPEASLQASGQRLADQIIDRMSAHERQLYTRMQELTPRVETYMQDLRLDPTLGAVPVGDRYQLGILHYDHGFHTTSFLEQPSSKWRQWIGPFDDLLTWPARTLVGLDVYRSSFARMLFPGADHFDRRHYRFVYLHQAFLGQVRCYVFDVAPLATGDKNAFWGRIWIEDHSDVLVRFNGSFWENRLAHPDLHFDSWRINVRPGVWVPAYIYTQEIDLNYGLFRHISFAAQTRLWGYDLHLAGRQQELTTMTLENRNTPPAAPPAVILSPLQSERDWQREAENNVLDRLEQAGLLAPAGPADAVLDTVVNNLIVTNHLNISPPVRCRILLTTPLESLAIGHTIVLSRGLIDSLPDEASLAAMLAHELASIDLGQQLNTEYAFADEMLFADQDSYRLLNLKRSPADEIAANTLAVKLLKQSPYQNQLASAGLFLRQVTARQKDSPHLFDPQLGNGWFSHDYLTKLAALESDAPALKPADVKQVAALPLGGRLLVNPWDGSITLQTPQAAPLLSAREKMPLQVTPFYPYLERVSASDDQTAAPVTTSAPVDDGGASPASAHPTSVEGSQ